MDILNIRDENTGEWIGIRVLKGVKGDPFTYQDWSDADKDDFITSKQLVTKNYVDKAKDSVLLKDQSTGAIYKLCIENGKLTLKGGNE